MASVDRVVERYAALKSVQPFTWKGNEAIFSAEGVQFEVAFKARSINHRTYGPISGFQAGFYQRQWKDAPWKYKPTGEGNAMAIFATVSAIVKDFLTSRKPQYVWFVADEPTRVRLYNKLIRRMVVPGYEAEINAEGIYMLRRTKSVFE